MSESNRTLKQEYKHSIKLIDDLNNSRERHDSTIFKEKLKETILSLESCELMISKLSLFSTNESLTDLITNEIPYIGLNYHLAKIYQLIIEQNKRINSISKTIKYYCKFLNDCFNYGLLNKILSKNEIEKIKEVINNGKITYDIIKKGDAMKRREDKIKRYKIEKELTNKLQFLNEKEKKNDLDDLDDLDEEVLRNLYLEQLQLFAIKSVGDLESSLTELELLQSMPSFPQREEPARDEREAERKKKELGFTENLESTKPDPILSSTGKILRPFTLVSKREDVKKKVYGYGQYMPTMSVEEYIDEEIKRGGILPDSSNTGTNKKGDESSDDEDDYEASDRKTYEKRDWDEFADWNKRGSGNRTNMG